MLTPWRRYGVGVDVHSQFAAVCVLVPVPNSSEMHKHENRFLVFADDLRRGRDWVCGVLRALGIAHEPLIYAIESTSTYHYPVLRSWGGTPIVVNPGLAAQYKARKTDKFDASVLAYQALTGLWATSHVPTEQTEELRLLMRTRRKLVRQRTQHFNAVGTRLAQWYCPLAGTSARSKKVRAIIEDAARGAFTSGDKSFLAAHLVPKRVWAHLLHHYAMTDVIDTEIAYFQTEAKAVADPALQERLMTAPGVGELTALTWQAEIEPAGRFGRVNEIVAYCGFDPTPMVSAGKTVGTRCRKGNSHIRTALVQAAHSCLNGQSALAAWGRSLNKHRNVQVTAVGRKLVSGLYRISLSGKTWEDNAYGQAKAGRGEGAGTDRSGTS